MSDFIGRPDSDDRHSYGSYHNQRISKHQSSIYDLYAVCNHHGDMSSGHYTAFCRNPINGRWYSFDDTRVGEVSSELIVTSDAYILFYAKRAVGANLLYDYFGTSTFSHWAEKVIAFCGENADDSDDCEVNNKLRVVDSTFMRLSTEPHSSSNDARSSSTDIRKSVISTDENTIESKNSIEDCRSSEESMGDISSNLTTESGPTHSEMNPCIVTKSKVLAETIV